MNAVGYDSQGNTGYGDLTGSANSYIFGPQGTIITTQPFIDRHVKGVNDIEYNMTTKGTTHYLKYDFDNSYLAGGDLGQDFGNHMNRRNGQDCLPYDHRVGQLLELTLLVMLLPYMEDLIVFLLSLDIRITLMD